MQLVRGTQRVLPIAMIRYMDGMNVVESIRVTTFVGSKMKVVTSTVRASGRHPRKPESGSVPDQAYIVQLAFYGVDIGKTPPSVTDNVGTRCSCFTGDTLVMLPEGMSVPIKELVGKDHFYVYSYDVKERKVKIAEGIQARKTGTRKVLKITLDNGTMIRSTEDHLFLKKDGTYCKASELMSGDSLMAAYRKLYQGRRSDPYRMICAPGMGFTMEHYLSDNFNLRFGFDTQENGNVRHHVDYNKYNNSPENIQRMTPEDHYILHQGSEEARKASSERMKINNPMCDSELSRRVHDFQKELKTGIYNPEFEPNLEGLERCWNDPEWRNKKSEGLSNTLKSMAKAGMHDSQVRVGDGTHHWQTKEHSKMISQRQSELNSGYRRGLKILSDLYKAGVDDVWSSYEERRRQGTPRLHLIVSKFGSLENAISKANDLYLNHKVVLVEEDSVEDVYDLSVPEFENFLIDVDNGADCSSGVFVHNCKAYYFWFAWPNMSNGCSFGTRFKPYVRKTPPDDKRYPPKNPGNIPGLCKHQLLVAATLQNSDFYKRVGA